MSMTMLKWPNDHPDDDPDQPWNYYREAGDYRDCATRKAEFLEDIGQLDKAIEHERDLTGLRPKTVEELWRKFEAAVARITRLEEEVSRVNRRLKELENPTPISGKDVLGAMFGAGNLPEHRQYDRSISEPKIGTDL